MSLICERHRCGMLVIVKADAVSPPAAAPELRALPGASGSTAGMPADAEMRESLLESARVLP